jgi:hypothetical protein
MIHLVKCPILVLLISVCSVKGFAQQNPSDAMRAPNTLYGELGGKGLAYGFYYERLIMPDLGVSVGFSTWDPSSSMLSPTLTIVPVFVSWYPGVNGRQSLYVDAGADYVSVSNMDVPLREVMMIDVLNSFSGHGWLPFLGTGYCYQRRSKGGAGFFFKIGPLFLFGPTSPYAWANLSLGLTF